MKKIGWLVFLCASIPLFGQSPIRYQVSFENFEHHELRVAAIFADLSPGPLQLRMSRTSPGRYALHEFAKNVYDVHAYDRQGKELKFARPDLHQWTIKTQRGYVKMVYTVYGDRCDGTYLAVDDSHAHINIPATFMWARGLEDRPIVVTFTKPNPEWHIVTQLVPASSGSFTAPNLEYFLDSPVEISAFDKREWQVEDHSGKKTVRLAVHHHGSKAQLDAFENMARAVVREEMAVFGEFPAWKQSTYTFIAEYLDYSKSDGMEHRNSTILTSSRSLKDGAVRNLNALSHEFFHSWNVERLRPRSLQPFNLEKANVSAELWFAEGFTSYYDSLFLRRAGIIDLDRYCSGLSRNLNLVLNSPGRDFYSLAQMSEQAPFVDAAVSIDSTNRTNTFVSYYPYGAVTGLALDLTLRTRFTHLSLDDFMRAMWRKFGSTEIPYTNDDLQKTLGEVTGDASFAADFFDHYVYGHDLPRLSELLRHAGLELTQSKKEESWIGRARFEFKDDKAWIRSATRIGSPLYRLGLDRGDAILSLDGMKLEDKDTLKQILDKHKPGDQLAVEFEREGEKGKGTLTLAPNPRWEVLPFEHLSRTVTASIAAFRQQWMGGKSGAEPADLKRYCPKCHRSFPFRYEYCRYDGSKLQLTPPKKP